MNFFKQNLLAAIIGMSALGLLGLPIFGNLDAIAAAKHPIQVVFAR